MKRIFLWGGWSRNYGDLAILDAQTTALKAINPYIDFVPINSDIIKGEGPELTPAMVDVINNTGDMLMVGGGGQIMYREPHTSKSGWQFNVEKSTLENLKVPLVIYSIGFNEFPFGSRVRQDSTVAHMKFVARKATLFSVRNRGTKKQLKNWGVLQDIEVVPDPAMFIKTYESPLIDSLCEGDMLKIGVCWAGDRIRDRLGLTIKQPLIDSICNQIKKFANGKAFKVFYIPHVSFYDIPDESYFRGNLSKSTFCYVPDKVPGYFPETLPMVRFVASLYKKMDIVIGFRGHSNIIPYGLGVPYVGMGDHAKNRYFSEMTGFPIVKTQDSSNLADAMKIAYSKKIIGTRRYKNHVATAEDFNQRVVDLLNG